MKKDRTEIYLRIERVLIPSLEFNSKNGCLIEYSILVTSRIEMNMQLIIAAINWDQLFYLSILIFQ